MDQLHAEPHHEQQRWVVEVADLLVDELDPVGLNALFAHRLK